MACSSNCQGQTLNPESPGTSAGTAGQARGLGQARGQNLGFRKIRQGGLVTTLAPFTLFAFSGSSCTESCMEHSCSGQPAPVLASRQLWERPRLQLCAERSSSQVQCSYHTFVETQCREVKGADGLPARKCTRTLQKFKDCGRCASSNACS